VPIIDKVNMFYVYVNYCKTALSIAKLFASLLSRWLFPSSRKCDQMAG